MRYYFNGRDHANTSQDMTQKRTHDNTDCGEVGKKESFSEYASFLSPSLQLGWIEALQYSDRSGGYPENHRICYKTPIQNTIQVYSFKLFYK